MQVVGSQAETKTFDNSHTCVVPAYTTSSTTGDQGISSRNDFFSHYVTYFTGKGGWRRVVFRVQTGSDNCLDVTLPWYLKIITRTFWWHCVHTSTIRYTYSYTYACLIRYFFCSFLAISCQYRGVVPLSQIFTGKYGRFTLDRCQNTNILVWFWTH